MKNECMIVVENLSFGKVLFEFSFKKAHVKENQQLPSARSASSNDDWFLPVDLDAFSRPLRWSFLKIVER